MLLLIEKTPTVLFQTFGERGLFVSKDLHHHFHSFFLCPHHRGFHSAEPVPSTPGFSITNQNADLTNRSLVAWHMVALVGVGVSHCESAEKGGEYF